MLKSIVVLLFVSSVLAWPSYIGDCTTTGAANGNGHTSSPLTGTGGFTYAGLPASINSTAPIIFNLTTTTATKFKGYNIYPQDLSGNRVGTWTILDTNTVVQSGCTNTIGHISNTGKSVIRLQYNPPNPPVTVTFKGTIVVSKGSTWYNLPSVTVVSTAASTSSGTGACTPFTNCALSNIQCGKLFDGCANLTCGTCTGAANCTGGKCVVAGCTPTTDCATSGAFCGTINNGCTDIACGTCTGAQTCDLNQCNDPPVNVPAPTPAAATNNDPFSSFVLPSWFGVAVGVAAGFLCWLMLFVPLVLYFRGRAKEKKILAMKAKEREEKQKQKEAEGRTSVDSSIMHPPPQPANPVTRALKRMSYAFASVPVETAEVNLESLQVSPQSSFMNASANTSQRPLNPRPNPHAPKQPPRRY